MEFTWTGEQRRLREAVRDLLARQRSRG